jgi:prepilin-type N-terminal cleavage/methylation domain-containing protein
MTKRVDSTHTHTHTPSRAAFTLIELLVVIAIIGLLSTIAVVSLSSARRLARNAKRIADVKQLVTAFSLGLDANGSYPSTGGNVWKCIGSVCTGGWSGYPASGTVDAFFIPFMNKPTDPDDKNSRTFGGYLYNGAATAANGLPAIDYLLEPPAACGVGTVSSTTANDIECIVSLY